MIAIEKLISEINALPESEYAEVVKFISLLKQKRNIPETLLLPEKALAEHWGRPEEDEAWAGL